MEIKTKEVHKMNELEKEEKFYYKRSLFRDYPRFILRLYEIRLLDCVSFCVWILYSDAAPESGKKDCFENTYQKRIGFRTLCAFGFGRCGGSYISFRR